jgi:tetraprenyl-beta-curcumene synthase
MTAGIARFYREAYAAVGRLPDARFHRLVTKGLLGIYCSDKKVHAQPDVRLAARRLAPLGGPGGVFFYFVCGVYRRMRVSNPRPRR